MIAVLIDCFQSFFPCFVAAICLYFRFFHHLSFCLFFPFSFCSSLCVCTGRSSPCRLSAHRHAVPFRKHRQAGTGRAHRPGRYEAMHMQQTCGAATMRRKAAPRRPAAGWLAARWPPAPHDDALLLTLPLLCSCALCAHVVLLRYSMEWRWCDDAWRPCVAATGDAARCCCCWPALCSTAPRHPSPRPRRIRCSQALVCSPTSPPLRLPRRPPRLLPPLPSRSALAPRWSAAPRSGTRR